MAWQARSQVSGRSMLLAVGKPFTHTLSYVSSTYACFDFRIVHCTFYVVCCALRVPAICTLRVARSSELRVPARCMFQRVASSSALRVPARCMFQRVACSSALRFSFFLQKERKAVLQKKKQRRKRRRRLRRERRERRETEAAAEGEEGRINFGREEEPTAQRKCPVT